MRPAPGGNATTNPSGWPPAPPARNSTAAASSPHPEPRQPDAEAADNWQQTRALQALAAQSEPGSISAWWQQFTAQADKTEAAIAAERQAATETGQPWPPKPHAARTRTRANRAPPCNGSPRQAPTPATSTRHGGRRSRPSRPPASKSRKPHAAKPQPAPSPSPTPKSRSTAPGTTTPENRAAEPEPLLAAPTEHDDPDAHETSSQYHARMQSYARWQPESHPEATAGPASTRSTRRRTRPRTLTRTHPRTRPVPVRGAYGERPGEGALHNGVTIMNAHEWPIVAKCVCYSYCPRFRH